MGLGLGAWSFIGGAKFFFTAGVSSKFGIASLLKAAGAAVLSSGITISLAAAAFGMTYLYNYAEN